MVITPHPTSFVLFGQTCLPGEFERSEKRAKPLLCPANTFLLFLQPLRGWGFYRTTSCPGGQAFRFAQACSFLHPKDAPAEGWQQAEGLRDGSEGKGLRPFTGEAKLRFAKLAKQAELFFFFTRPSVVGVSLRLRRRRATHSASPMSGTCLRQGVIVALIQQ